MTAGSECSAGGVQSGETEFSLEMAHEKTPGTQARRFGVVHVQPAACGPTPGRKRQVFLSAHIATDQRMLRQQQKCPNVEGEWVMPLPRE
jgi:hypothetical protein